MPRPRIAIVTDEPTFAFHLAADVRAAGCDVLPVADGRRALKLLRAERPDAVVVEGRMDSHILAADLVDAIGRDDRIASMRVVVCSADASFLSHHADALRRSGYRVLSKPLDMSQLIAAVLTPGTPWAASTELEGAA